MWSKEWKKIEEKWEKKFIYEWNDHHIDCMAKCNFNGISPECAGIYWMSTWVQTWIDHTQKKNLNILFLHPNPPCTWIFYLSGVRNGITTMYNITQTLGAKWTVKTNCGRKATTTKGRMNVRAKERKKKWATRITHILNSTSSVRGRLKQRV